jgi:hypothetical protein
MISSVAARTLSLASWTRREMRRFSREVHLIDEQAELVFKSKVLVRRHPHHFAKGFGERVQF